MSWNLYIEGGIFTGHGTHAELLNIHGEPKGKTACGEPITEGSYWASTKSTRKWPSCQECRDAMGLLTGTERAELAGAEAARSGRTIDACPYPDHRTGRGSVTFSRGLRRAWRKGFQSA